MDKELNEDARTKQDLLYECSSLKRKLSDEIIKNEHLEQQCKKQKEVIDKIRKEINEECSIMGVKVVGNDVLEDILKEVE